MLFQFASIKQSKAIYANSLKLCILLSFKTLKLRGGKELVNHLPGLAILRRGNVFREGLLKGK